MRQSIILGFGFVFSAITLGCEAASSGSLGAPDGQWPSYGGDLGSTKYADLSQITADNVGELDVVWRWDAPDGEIASANRARGIGVTDLKATPLMVDGVLFLRTSLSIVVALDAETGEELWSHDPGSWEMGRPVNLGFNSRGVAYWEDEALSTVFVATGDAHLVALDAATGEPRPEFADQGRIDLTEGLRRPVDRRIYGVMSPPLVVGDVVIVGSSINDVPRYKTAPPGDVRAFDVRTGELVWTFHTVPQEGELGNETWLEGSWEYTGNTNVWTIMSADPELGLVYLPVGTPTNDWYGGHRLGDDLFAESLVALDAATGEYRWHFQTVHHGVWDYDPPAAPALIDLTVDGEAVKAVAQITKQGFVFVLDRETGEPVWPIEERPVPPSTVPGDQLSPTQPFPTKPPPFERQGVHVDELIDFTPELRAEAEAIVEDYDYGPLYEPPTERGTINLPGWQGGGNWYGGAFDPETGYFYVPSRTAYIVVQLVEGDPESSDFRYLRGGRTTVNGPQGLPLTKPPYSRIVAYDMNEGEIAWQVPHGNGVRQRLIDMGVPDPGPVGGGNFTGPVLTRTLLFFGHGGNRQTGEPPVLRAFDKATGDIVATIELPAPPSGTPMTYMQNGRQFIAVAYGDRGETGLLGLALPEGTQ